MKADITSGKFYINLNLLSELGKLTNCPNFPFEVERRDISEISKYISNRVGLEPTPTKITGNEWMILHVINVEAGR